jgi:hypothetical protein
MSNKIKLGEHPTKSPKVNRSREYRPERMDFGSIGMDEVGSPTTTTLENNKKFRQRDRAETEFAGGVGGEEGIRTLETVSRLHP